MVMMYDRQPWTTRLTDKRPRLHMCGLRCWIRCHMGSHHRTSVDNKCFCCDRIDISYAQEAALSPRSEGITSRWWE
jgi:hypothetical protein